MILLKHQGKQTSFHQNQNKHLLPDDPDHGCYIIQLFMVMPVASFIKKSPLQNLLDIIEQYKDYKPFKR